MEEVWRLAGLEGRDTEELPEDTSRSTPVGIHRDSRGRWAGTSGGGDFEIIGREYVR